MIGKCHLEWNRTCSVGMRSFCSEVTKFMTLCLPQGRSKKSTMSQVFRENEPFLVPANGSCKPYALHGSVVQVPVGHYSKEQQYMYVNKRPCSSRQLEDFINELFLEACRFGCMNRVSIEQKYPSFLLNIAAPTVSYEFVHKNGRNYVEFQDISKTTALVEAVLSEAWSSLFVEEPSGVLLPNSMGTKHFTSAKSSKKSTNQPASSSGLGKPLFGPSDRGQICGEGNSRKDPYRGCEIYLSPTLGSSTRTLAYAMGIEYEQCSRAASGKKRKSENFKHPSRSSTGFNGDCDGKSVSPSGFLAMHRTDQDQNAFRSSHLQRHDLLGTYERRKTTVMGTSTGEKRPFCLSSNWNPTQNFDVPRERMDSTELQFKAYTPDYLSESEKESAARANRIYSAEDDGFILEKFTTESTTPSSFLSSLMEGGKRLNSEKIPNSSYAQFQNSHGEPSTEVGHVDSEGFIPENLSRLGQNFEISDDSRGLCSPQVSLKGQEIHPEIDPIKEAFEYEKEKKLMMPRSHGRSSQEDALSSDVCDPTQRPAISSCLRRAESAPPFVKQNTKGFHSNPWSSLKSIGLKNGWPLSLITTEMLKKSRKTSRGVQSMLTKENDGGHRSSPDISKTATKVSVDSKDDKCISTTATYCSTSSLKTSQREFSFQTPAWGDQQQELPPRVHLASPQHHSSSAKAKGRRKHRVTWGDGFRSPSSGQESKILESHLNDIPAFCIGPSIDPVRSVASLQDISSLQMLVPSAITRAVFDESAILSQFEKKFVLLTSGDVVMAMDQHAADERCRLESLQEQLTSDQVRCKILESQALEKPLGLKLSMLEQKVDHVSSILILFRLATSKLLQLSS